MLPQIWVSQPRVWEGVVLLPKYLGVRDTTDKMADALLSLPLQQLQVRERQCYVVVDQCEGKGG